MQKNTKGFSTTAAIIIVVLLIALIIDGTYWMINKDKLRDDGPKLTAEQQSILWRYSGTEWEPGNKVPTCPSPFIVDSPISVDQATGVLYPGQTRGGNYKPHGGFAFGNSKDNLVTVKVPFDGQVTRAARYIEQDETQYMFDIQHPCGYMVRFDHLLTLSPTFATIADELPVAQVDQSQTHAIDPVSVMTGDLVATAVGFKTSPEGTPNVTIDFGLYDLRNKNQIAQTNNSWMAQHENEKELAYHGLCFLDYMNNTDRTLLSKLPGVDGKAGKTSDYCN